uniref:Uncharacterized protein n=1 Tax=Parascaris equorum TaxID=6256 RepID=A0A914RRE5_PAREQ
MHLSVAILTFSYPKNSTHVKRSQHSRLNCFMGT